jgi:hypothetical protein
MAAVTVLLTGAQASAQMITAYTREPFTFTVDVPGVSDDQIEWEIYNEFTGINLAVVPGNCPPALGDFVGGDNIGASVQIVWNEPGIYLVKVHATNSCPTDNMKFYLVEVLQSLPEATIQDPQVICEGDSILLVIDLEGEFPMDLILHSESVTGVINDVVYTGITASPFEVLVSPTETTIYTVTEITNIDGTNTEPSNSVTLTVNPRPDLNSPIYQYEP